MEHTAKRLRRAAAPLFVALLALAMLGPKACQLPPYIGPLSVPAAPVPAAPVPAQPEPEPAGPSLSLVLVGDIMLARRIGRQIDSFGPDQPFSALGDFIRSHDLAFANLESPAARAGSPAFSWKPENVTFRAHPDSLLGLKAAGFSIVSLANNHATDYGRVALTETTEHLDALGIAWAGAGRDAAQARSPAILEASGLRIAFLAYCEHIGSAYEASTDRAGIAMLRQAQVLNDIATVRELGVDYLFVSLHWGDEYIHYPEDRQRSLAKRMIDQGADAIIGHHAHVVQGIEIYRDRPIIYSLGNFVFDQPWEHTRTSMAVSLRLDSKRLLSLAVHPLRIDHPVYRPYLASGLEAENIMTDIQTYSQPFATVFSVEEDRLVYSFPERSADWLLRRRQLAELVR